MRTHGQVLELLADFVAGRLTGRTASQVQAHIAACASCKQWVETYRLFREELQELAPPAAGHLSSELLARLAGQPESLGEAEREAAASHLEVCDSCSHQLHLSQEAISSVSHQHLGGEPSSRRRGFPAPRVWLGLAAALIIIVLGGPFLLGRLDRIGPSEGRLSGMKLRGAKTIQSRQSIIADAVEIEAGANVTFRAGETVILGNGFSVGRQARFVVEIQGTAPSSQESDQNQEERSHL